MRVSLNLFEFRLQRSRSFCIYSIARKNDRVCLKMAHAPLRWCGWLREREGERRGRWQLGSSLMFVETTRKHPTLFCITFMSNKHVRKLRVQFIKKSVSKEEEKLPCWRAFAWHTNCCSFASSSVARSRTKQLTRLFLPPDERTEVGVFLFFSASVI